MRSPWHSCLLSLLLTTIAGPISAEVVYLADEQGNEYRIGTLQISPEGGYSLEMDRAPFKDFFLSMKEMKCLEGRDIWCHIPYPYDMPREVVGDDYRWLSQDLLFMYKTPGEFGANLWQGIYYQIGPNDGVLRGRAMHVDLNELASPPDDLSTPFYDEQWLEPVSVDDRWLPHLIVR